MNTVTYALHDSMIQFLKKTLYPNILHAYFSVYLHRNVKFLVLFLRNFKFIQFVSFEYLPTYVTTNAIFPVLHGLDDKALDIHVLQSLQDLLKPFQIQQIFSWYVFLPNTRFSLNYLNFHN